MSCSGIAIHAMLLAKSTGSGRILATRTVPVLFFVQVYVLAIAMHTTDTDLLPMKRRENDLKLSG
jgi:hypothetical protein